MTIFNLEQRPVARIQTLACFGQFPQRTEQWYEHKLLWNIQSPPFLESPLCNLYTFFPETPLPLFHLMQCLYNFESYYTSGWDSEEVICVRKRYRKGGWKRNRSCVFPGTKTHLWIGTDNEEIINHLIIMCSPGPAEGVLPTPKQSILLSDHTWGTSQNWRFRKKNKRRGEDWRDTEWKEGGKKT